MIRMIDLTAPVAVTAVDLVVESTKPEWNKTASYIVAGSGYLASYLNYGGEFARLAGVAAFPWAAKNIYNWARGLGGGTSRMGRRVSRYPAPAQESPFQGARLV